MSCPDHTVPLTGCWRCNFKGGIDIGRVEPVSFLEQRVSKLEEEVAEMRKLLRNVDLRTRR